jgi:predicted GNAT superfamily acetyltransferase
MVTSWSLHILENVDDMAKVEDIQRQVWPESETEVVPAHLLLTAVHNGGVAIGAYFSPSEEVAGSRESPTDRMVGFVFGFPGIYTTPDGPRPKHCSHMMGVLPGYRDQGLGFALKRAQWQMVRHQGLDRITWTFDPLLSRNAYLNITRLGGVCNTYLRDAYGQMRDNLNFGLPSDRLQIDWWINTARVERRLSSKPRLALDLAHFLPAGARIINPTEPRSDGWIHPRDSGPDPKADFEQETLLLLEIPPDFLALKAVSPDIALAWRLHTRAWFEDLFKRGYLITDFIHLPGISARSFYVLSHGESTL